MAKIIHLWSLISKCCLNRFEENLYDTIESLKCVPEGFYLDNKIPSRIVEIIKLRLNNAKIEGTKSINAEIQSIMKALNE